jgi:hypothetical protein
MKGSAIMNVSESMKGKQIQAWTHEYFMYGNTLKCSWFFIKQDYGNGDPINKPRDHLKQTSQLFYLWGSWIVDPTYWYKNNKFLFAPGKVPSYLVI